MKYIGESEIKEVIGDGEDLTIKFEEGTEDITMKQELFEMIAKEGKGKGTVTDVVRFIFATKFLKEMSDLGLEYYMVENVAVGMGTLLHNMREEAISKHFECAGSLNIPLEKLIPEEE